MNNYKRGSEWGKWDLHVHTKGTNKNDQFLSSSFEEFCKILFSKAIENNIVSIGIADYFSVENYKKVKEFVENIDDLMEEAGGYVFTDEERTKIKNILVLPNVELRMLPSTGSGRLINIHCLFNPEFIQSLENDFFGSLAYSAGSSQSFKMNRSGLIDLGKSLDENLNDDEAYRKGVNTFVVSHGDLQKLLDNNKKFRENVIVAVSNSSSDGASGLQSHYDLFENDTESQLDAVRKSIYAMSGVIFSGNLEDRRYFLGQKEIDTKEQVIEKCGSLKPCIQGSDAHTEENLFVLGGGKFCWIKSNPTFEGLKQVLWEPEGRVMIQERNPIDSKSMRTIIEKVEYNTSQGDLKTVIFNPDLNSVIGIRGSGKSTLLKNIANKIDSVQYGEKDAKEPYPIENFNVYWADGIENDGDDESPKSIFYIPQGYLSALVYDDGEHTSDRDDFLTGLFKKNVQFSSAIQAFNVFASENKLKIEGLIEELLTNHVSAKESLSSLKKIGSKIEIEKEISEKEQEIKQHKGTSISDEDIKAYTAAKKNVTDGVKKIRRSTQDKSILTILKKDDVDVTVSFHEFGRLSLRRQEFFKSEILQKGQENLVDLVNHEIEIINKEIGDLTSVIETEQEVIEHLKEQVEKSRALEDLTKELGELQETLEKIIELSQKLENAQASCDDIIEKLIQFYIAFGVRQKAIYEIIDFEQEFSFVQIEIVTKCNTQKIRDFVERNINTRDSDFQLKQEEDIKNLFGEFPVELVEHTLKKIIIALLDERLKIKVEAGDIATVISQLLKNKYEIDYLNSVKTKENNVYFKDMTGGQKAITLLELVFRFDDEKYPILIDQPEDDLDVSGVATDLVDFIKSEKKDRQIIIVSHNGSLVVCSDAEEIISSDNIKNDDGQFDFMYKTGAIENLEMQEDVILILEGGREALQLRAKKLNFDRNM